MIISFQRVGVPQSVKLVAEDILFIERRGDGAVVIVSKDRRKYAVEGTSDQVLDAIMAALKGKAVAA